MEKFAEEYVHTMLGISPEELAGIKQANSFLDDNYVAESFNRGLIKSAACLLKMAGTEQGDALATKLVVMEKMAWTAMHSEVKDSIMESVSTSVKHAGWVEDVQELAKTIGLLPVGVGALGGGAYFALNQHTKRDDAKNEELKQMIRHYDTVTKELENRLAPKLLSPTPTEV